MTDVAELRKRIAAASAYGGFSLDALADEIGMSRSTFYRRLRELSEPRRRDPFLTLVADRCKLNAAFFTVDFERLPEFDEPATTETSGDDGLRAQLRALEERLDALRADHELLAAEAHRRTDASDQTNPGQDQPGPPQ